MAPHRRAAEVAAVSPLPEPTALRLIQPANSAFIKSEWPFPRRGLPRRRSPSVIRGSSELQDLTVGCFDSAYPCSALCLCTPDRTSPLWAEFQQRTEPRIIFFFMQAISDKINNKINLKKIITQPLTLPRLYFDSLAHCGCALVLQACTPASARS